MSITPDLRSLPRKKPQALGLGFTTGRLIDAIEFIAGRRTPFTQKELATHIDASAETARTYLWSLEARGFATYLGTGTGKNPNGWKPGRWEAGPRLRRIAQ